jgi:hypothetical protein
MNPQLAFTHPELVRRYEMLVARMWRRGWDIGITSSSRSEAQQRLWYQMYLRGEFANIVANPDRIYARSPWGWVARGSMHMIQADGYSHALDVNWTGCTGRQMLDEAYMVGLFNVEPTENWHLEAWDYRGYFEVIEDEDDMDQAQFNQLLANAIGRQGPHVGNTRVTDVVQVRLNDDPNEPGVEQWWAISEAVEFIHRHLKEIDRVV